MKRTLKRIAAVCLSLVMVLGYAGCKEEPAEQPTGPTEAELTAVREELKKNSEIKGLGDITAMELYENGVRVVNNEINEARDNKKIYHTADFKRVVNYVDGYIIDIPLDWVPDYSLSLRARYDTDEVSLIATREDEGVTYHKSVESYLADTYKVLKSPDFQRNNNITLIEDVVTSEVNGWTVETYRLKLEDCKEGTKCYYTYADFYNDLNQTVHMMFKAVDDRDFSDVINSFQRVAQKGYGADNWTYPQSNNPNWNETTTNYYENLKVQDHVDWGLFSYKLQNIGWKVNIPLLEKNIDFEFPIISEYIHYGAQPTVNSNLVPGAFPVDFSNQVEADGRMMQITYQYTVNNNTDLTHINPMLDIYRETDTAMSVITDFAEGAAEFDQPFFFRLNNEMNTDWTSYCGIANMLDPDIFQETWITLYDVFTETGANEYAMWVFNGFDKSYPPYKWCDYRCYMPPAEYVDLIGLTGYNMGTNNGQGVWKSFSELYDGICENAGYNEYFSDWPWIISEFGCVARDDVEGQGVDAKAAWITEMFDCFEQNKYPNIKVAVWFNANDYVDGMVTNELVIDKDPEVYEAFAEGLARTQP